jgi:hypothetical protein
MAVRDFQLAEFIRTIHKTFLTKHSPYPIVLWTKAIYKCNSRRSGKCQRTGNILQHSNHRSGVYCSIKHKFCYYSKHCLAGDETKTGRKKQRAQVLRSAELRITMLRKKMFRKTEIRKIKEGHQPTNARARKL